MSYSWAVRYSLEDKMRNHLRGCGHVQRSSVDAIILQVCWLVLVRHDERRKNIFLETIKKYFNALDLVRR